MKRAFFPLLLVGVVLASCSSSSAPHEGPARPAVVVVGGDVLASVDGVAITRAQVALASSAGPSPHGGAAPQADAVLERLVQEEVFAQRALAEHLDQDAAYLEELAPREAQLTAWKRERLAGLYEERAASRRPAVTEAEARAYYDANATKVRTEVRVAQILMRDEARITQALADLRAGTPFDDVAVRAFPPVPDLVNKPWELPALRWSQVPPPWQPVIDGLAVGQISDVIRGVNNRFWIIKVLERRENPAFTFEASRPLIEAFLRTEAQLGARDRLYREARASAHIVYAHPPTAPAPAP